MKTTGNVKMETNASGRVVKRGKLKVWTGAVPNIPLEKAVEQLRHPAIKSKDMLIATQDLEVDLKELDKDLRREREENDEHLLG